MPSATTTPSAPMANSWLMKPGRSSGEHSGAGLILRYSLQTGLTDLVNTNANVPTGALRGHPQPGYDPGRALHRLHRQYERHFRDNHLRPRSGMRRRGATTLASGDLSNNVPAGSTCDWPAIDSSGRFVAFLSSATNLVTNSLAGDYHLYVRDMQAGAPRRWWMRIPMASVRSISPATAPPPERRWPLRRLRVPRRQPGAQ